MWSFLHQKYESTGQSTYLAAIRQEQLLRQGDSTVEDFFDQLSVVWRQLDTLNPQLSPATCQSCRDQTAALELRQTYDFLTRLRDEFDPLRAQLLARRPYVSLIDTLAEVRNEEDRLRDAGLLQFDTVLAARSSASHSSSARATASVPLASPLVVPPAARGESGGIHYAHCGRDGHSDVWGSTPFVSKAGHKYYIIFIDNFSCHTRIYFMKHRSEALSINKNFSVMILTHFDTPIRVFCADSAGEYLSDALR
jgi:hypothetical protein